MNRASYVGEHEMMLRRTGGVLPALKPTILVAFRIIRARWSCDLVLSLQMAGASIEEGNENWLLML